MSSKLRAKAILTSQPPAAFAVAQLGPSLPSAFSVQPGDTFAFQYAPEHGALLADYLESLAHTLRETPELAATAIEKAEATGAIRTDGPTVIPLKDTLRRIDDDKDLN